MFVQVLADDLKSWIIPYTRDLVSSMSKLGYESELIHSSKDIKAADVLFILGCTKIIKKEFLDLPGIALVVHESDLPKGKGWSPLTWLILKGQNDIPICLIKAREKVDSGDILLKKEISFRGDELIEELKHRQGLETINICLEYLEKRNELKPQRQSGEETFYPRRTPDSSRLDVDKSIRDQFNLLRVCDNDRYPAFFEINNVRYYLKIYKQHPEGKNESY